MTEMVIPGTYITVRAEGLISAGGVATGIVGIVGTAANGPVGVPVTLSGFTDARDRYGLPDDFDRPEDGANPLTLVRALEHIYKNGATSVVAVRVAGPNRSDATFAVQDDDGRAVTVLTARTPGTWGNSIRILSEQAEDPCRVEEETHTDSFDRLDRAPIRPSPENRISVTRGATRRAQPLVIVYKEIRRDEEAMREDDDYFLATPHADPGRPAEEVPAVNSIRVLGAGGQVARQYGDGDILYGAGDPPGAGEIRVDRGTGELTFEAGEVPTATQRVVATYAVGHPPPEAGQVLVTVWDGSLDFATGEAPQQSSGDRLVASYLIEPEACAQVTLAYGTIVERYIAPDGDLLAQLVNRSSRLVSAEADATHADSRPRTDLGASYFGTGANEPGNSGAEAGEEEYELGLEALANMVINIVVLAGQDAETMGSSLLGHLNSTEQTDFERICVIGAAGETTAEFLGHTTSDDRMILVAPGLRSPGGKTLPAAYTAAAVAGLISSYPVQTSLANKTLNVPGLATSFNRGEQGQLIRRNVLAVVERDNSFRVLKGITTEGESFSAIPTRRIVDYAKYGVRSAANPYIGRLNNSRVRAALQSTLDAFLTRMVEDEALTGYELQVTATRPQEIAGEVHVVMTLQPTFSIDFIRVVMNLS